MTEDSICLEITFALFSRRFNRVEYNANYSLDDVGWMEVQYPTLADYQCWLDLYVGLPLPPIDFSFWEFMWSHVIWYQSEV